VNSSIARLNEAPAGYAGYWHIPHPDQGRHRPPAAEPEIGTVADRKLGMVRRDGLRRVVL
jgi:hypothetical protein